MRYAKRIAAVAAGFVAALALASPAQAGHNGVNVEVGEAKACTEIVFTTSWEHGEHLSANALLVVSIAGQVKTAPVGEPIGVGPFAEPTTVHWRVFGGGERDYDLPLWNGYGGGAAWGAEITKYAADNGGWDWTVASPDDLNPFTNWYSFEVDGCAAPQAPELTAATCDALAQLAVPEVQGVVYSHTSGPLNPGVHTVTAEPADGYEFEAGAEAEWTFEVQAEPGCPGQPGQDGTDGSDGAAGSAGGSDGDGAKLPVTGSAPMKLAAAAGGFGAAGLAAVVLPVWWARRRRNALIDAAGE